jgi:hypothetical protein
MFLLYKKKEKNKKTLKNYNSKSIKWICEHIFDEITMFY